MEGGNWKLSAKTFNPTTSRILGKQHQMGVMSRISPYNIYITTLNAIIHPSHFLGWVNIFEKAALIPHSFSFCFWNKTTMKL